MTLAWKRSCQGCTQCCKLLTCVLVSPTPQVSADHIDDAVDEDEEADMKCRKGNNGVSITGGSLCTLFTNIHSVHNFVHYLYTIEAVHYWIYCWTRGEKTRNIGSK